MAELKPTPLILFSGLAADANVFALQKAAFPELIVPSWPIPGRNETIDAYCDRLASEFQPHGRVILGGASFGGIIALHVAKRIHPIAVLLIGSVRSPTELSRLVRMSRPLKPMVQLIPVRLLQICCAPFASKLARRLFPHLGILARQFCDADPRVFKWSIARILDWNSTPNPDCPVFQIHGQRDFVLPVRFTRSDTIINGGGHVISLTHPTAVNDFIRSTMSLCMGEQSHATTLPLSSTGSPSRLPT